MYYTTLPVANNSVLYTQKSVKRIDLMLSILIKIKFKLKKRKREADQRAYMSGRNAIKGIESTFLWR